MEVENLRLEIVNLLKSIEAGIREVEFCLSFTRLKREENQGHSYVNMFFQTESDIRLTESIARLNMLLNELKGIKEKPGMDKLMKKYSQWIKDLESKATTLFRKVT